MYRAVQALSVFALSTLLTGSWTTNVAAQNAAVTFRMPQTPNPLGQPFIGQDGFVSPAAMVPSPILSPQDRKYSDFSGAEMKGMIGEIVAISLKDRDSGNVYWGRNIGTQGHVDAEDWTLARFRKYGLVDVHKETLDIKQPQWTPKSYSINFVSDGQSFKLPSARPSQSLSTPPEGLDLDLVWLGLGTEADFLGRDVKGKAVVIQDIPLPGDIRHSALMENVVKRAFDHGAAAVGLAFGTSDNFSLWQRTGGKYGFNLGYEDGIRIRDMLGAGKQVKVQYKLDAEMRTGAQSASVWGTLSGATDEKILVVAHLDGYFQAAMDNASGMAMMMAMIEHYAKIPKKQRRRTMVFLGSVGHHSGPGTLSVHQNLDWPKVAWVINLEHVAVNGTEYWGPNLVMTTAPAPLRWALNASPAVLKVVTTALQHFNVPVLDGIDSTVGEIGAIYHDAPSLTLITSPMIKHTEQDTPEWIPAAGLESVARAHASVIDQLNRMEIAQILPGKWPEAALARRGAPTGGD